MANSGIRQEYKMTPHGRSLGEFTPLLPAEKKLFIHCQSGTTAFIDFAVPDKATDDNTVRATFIRFLMLGGDDRVAVHERGLSLNGAWVTGELDLSHVSILIPVNLTACNFSKNISFENARFSSTLSLARSSLKKINASGVVGDSFFLTEIVALGELNFVTAKLSYFSCAGAKLNGLEGDALVLSGAEFSQSVFFDDGFEAIGAVYIVGATIGGQLGFTGAFIDNPEEDSNKARDQKKFALALDGTIVKQDVFLNGKFTAVGDVSMVGTQVFGDLSISDATIGKLEADRITVKGALHLKNCKDKVKTISLVGASIVVLKDECDSWPKNVDLNGFVYDFIEVSHAETAKQRLNWLDAQCGENPDQGPSRFRPQPWRQLQRVLETMGHMEDARYIGIEYEKRLQKYGVMRQGGIVKTVLHYFYGKLTGFGYRPQWLLRWFFGVWLFCTIFYWWAAISAAVFAPTNPIVFQNEAYSSCRPRSLAENQLYGSGNWYLCEALREEYTGFSPMAFSLDLLLPLVDLHQENDWGPLIQTPKANAWEEIKGIIDIRRLVRIVMWGEILAGWGFSLLFVAIVSGLTRRSE
jgi:uncharacterized protein YjbI with pentapeptide repeats